MRTTTASTAPPISRASGEFRHGWKALLTAGVAIGLGPIIFLQTNGLFVAPIREDTGLSATAVQMGTVVMFVGAFSGVLAGFLADRLGTRRMVLMGSPAMALSVVLFAILPPTAFSFYAIAVLVGLTGAFASYVPMLRMLTTWFHKGYGTAQGLMTAGASIVPLLLTPVIVQVIYSMGWRAGYAFLAIVILVVALPVLFIGFRENPASAKYSTTLAGAGAKSAEEPGLSVRQAVRAPRLWVVIVSCMVAGVAISGFTSSIAPATLDAGFAVEIAGAATMVYLAGIIGGRVGAGLMLDKMWPHWVPLVVCVTSGGAGIVLALIIGALPPLVLFALVFILGFCQGAEADFPAFFTLMYAGKRSFGAIFGWVMLVMAPASLIGAFGFAAVKDATGSYLPAWALGGVLYIIGGLAAWLAGYPKRKTFLDEHSTDATAAAVPLDEDVVSTAS